MPHRPKRISLAAWLYFGAVALAPSQEPDGAAIYAERCAACHDQPSDQRAPARASLATLAPEHLAAAMLTGPMSLQAAGLNAAAIDAVALHVSDFAFGEVAAAEPSPNPCQHQPPRLNLDAAQWNGWGRDPANTRFQPDPGFTLAAVPRLELQWAYAYPGASAYGQPTPIGDRVFVTSQLGHVSALDSETGCTLWQYQATRGVRSAVTVVPWPGAGQRLVVLFADEGGSAHALDADSGEAIWTTPLDEHAAVRITGAPTHFEGTLYVPISSLEEVAARSARYACCTFRGAIVAVDVVTGDILWKSHGIREEPRPTKRNSAGTQMYGPAGGAIWGAPTIDAARRLVYAGTGNSYTDVVTDGSNAVAAFDLDSGERRWIRQTTSNDNYLLGCAGDSVGEGNCPETAGPDHDFGASVILKTLADGRDIVVAGQKSGIVYALDPDADGAILWQTAVGAGSPLGGIEWGMAADDDNVYVANSDVYADSSPRPGLTAVRLGDGATLWHVPAPATACSWQGSCGHALSAAVTAMPGAVFAGSFDGHLRAHATRDGAILWDFDSGRPFNTVNGVTETGGHFDGPGPTIAGGKVFVNSGALSWGGHAARLLLVFGAGEP